MNRIKKINQYFDQPYADWNILDFLEESKGEPFQILTDSYLRYLKHIIQSEQGSKKEKAQLLINKYKKVIFSCFFVRSTKPVLGHQAIYVFV